MNHNSFYESPKEFNLNCFGKILFNKEINLENILENENYIKVLRTNPNNPLKVIFTTDNIKIMIRYCIKSEQNNNNSKIRDNLCEVLCSHCALFFKKSIYNIKLSNKLINRYNNMTKIEKNNIKEAKNEDDEKEGNNLVIFPFKEVKFNNKIIFSANENIIENKDSIVKLFKDQNIYIIEHKSEKNTYQYNIEEINIINEILSEIFDISNFTNYEKEDSDLFYFQKIVKFLLHFESDTLINYLIKDTSSQIIKFLLHNLNRAKILNLLENILNILSDNKEPNNANNNISFQFSKYAQIIQDLVNILIEDCQNNKFDRVDYACKLIINTVINNSENELIELFIENDKLIQKIKKLIKEIVNKNSFKQICDRETVLVNILQVLYQLNNIIISSFNESNFYKDNKKDIDIPQINDNKINNFENKSRKSISYKNIFKAFDNKSNLFLSNINDIFILISKDIIELFKKNVNNNGIDNQIISIKNLNKWEFILSCLKLYIYSYYAIKDFNNAVFNTYFSSGQDLMEIAIQYYLKFPQDNSYQNIFLEIIQLICCEKCPEFLINPFLKISEEKKQKQNEFILQLKNSLENCLKKKQYDSIDYIIKILNAFYTSSNNTILNFFKNSNLDKTYKNIFIENNLNEEYEYSNSEIFNSDNDDENTFDGNDREYFRESELFLKLIENFITKCNNIVK